VFEDVKDFARELLSNRSFTVALESAEHLCSWQRIPRWIEASKKVIEAYVTSHILLTAKPRELAFPNSPASATRHFQV
jgi:hypothetical protein